MQFMKESSALALCGVRFINLLLIVEKSVQVLSHRKMFESFHNQISIVIRLDFGIIL